MLPSVTIESKSYQRESSEINKKFMIRADLWSTVEGMPNINRFNKRLWS